MIQILKILIHMNLIKKVVKAEFNFGFILVSGIIFFVKGGTNEKDN